MIIIYNKTSIGYSHINKGTVCQDYSEHYISEDYRIVTACDGHGGSLYVRSDRGSKLASQAVIEVISKYSYFDLHSLIESDALNKIKLEVLCKWNELIEKDYSNDKFSIDELSSLSEEQQFKLENNFVTAYGTTLNAIIETSKYMLCFQIGDGGLFLLKDESMVVAFPENDENVANLTQSMCGDKAYNHLFIKAFNKDDYKGGLICTDGLLGPYQTYNNFSNSFVKPIVNKLKVLSTNTFIEIDSFIEELGTKIGNGDDVSLGLIYYG